MYVYWPSSHQCRNFMSYWSFFTVLEYFLCYFLWIHPHVATISPSFQSTPSFVTTKSTHIHLFEQSDRPCSCPSVLLCLRGKHALLRICFFPKIKPYSSYTFLWHNRQFFIFASSYCLFLEDLLLFFIVYLWRLHERIEGNGWKNNSVNV